MILSRGTEVIMFHRSSILARLWIGGSIVRSMRIKESSYHPVTISRSSPPLLSSHSSMISPYSHTAKLYYLSQSNESESELAKKKKQVIFG